MKRTNVWRTGVAAGLVLCAGLAIGTVSPWGPSGAAAQPERESLVVDSAQLQEDLHQARGLSRAFQHAASLVEDSVVHITTKSSRVASDFFGRRVRRQASGLGSGVVVSEDGYILTNNHVIEDATELMVRFAGGREYEATLVGGDALRDIAVLKVDATGLQPARFGDSESMEVGEWVLAIGSPFGFDRTVTAGIISAKGRGLGIVSDEFKDAEQFIQTDAAINPGNSGGALINLDGEVVGINSAIFSRTGGSVGLGFSIPIELASAVYTNIVNDGRVDFGWLGVEIDSSGDAVRVARVLEDSPAESAGLRSGDRVLRYQGRPVTSGSQLIRSIQFTPPGSDAALDVIRDGRPVELRAHIVSRTDAEVERLGGQEIVSLGVVAMTATPESLGTGTGTEGLGVYILDITPNGLAARAGLARGDMIVAVNRQPVRTVDAMVAELGKAGRAVRIDLQRGKERGFTTLRR